MTKIGKYYTIYNREMTVTAYKVSRPEERKLDDGTDTPVHVFRVGFGELSYNDRKVVDATREIRRRARRGSGAQVALVRGRMPAPVAFALAYRLFQEYPIVGVFDEDFDGYIVTGVRAGFADYSVGDIVLVEEVIGGEI